MIASDTHHRKDFALMSQSHQMTLAMHQKLLEPNTKEGQGADLSIMTALTLTNPGAKSLFDLGARCKPRSETTRGMIAAFDSMLGGTKAQGPKAQRPKAPGPIVSVFVCLYEGCRRPRVKE